MPELSSARLTGHATAFPVAQEAHATLRRYLEEARAALRGDPDSDEVVRDLEQAIGERLSALKPTAKHPIGSDQMRVILHEIGPVNQDPVPVDPSVANASRVRTVSVPRGRFWCRIDEGKWFGGICQGIAARGNFDVAWVRTVVLFLLLVTGGIVGLIYLALLLVLPEVPTVAEYERLRDSPVAAAGLE